jgi:hypothetical protein
VAYGFLRTVDGTITSFQVPNGSSGASTATIPEGINMGSDIAGWYLDASGAYQGFLRTP